MHDLSDIAHWLQQHPIHRDPAAHGARGDTLVSFSSNNYLALASHPRLLAAAGAGLARYGVGGGESRLLGGDLEIYRELERRLGALTHKTDAVLFVTGYMANIGVLSSMVKAATLARLHGFRARKRRKYAYYSDELNHISISEGIQLSGALRYHYRHRDMNHLESLLLAGAADGATPIIVSDGVFGMEGTIAPLPQLAELAERFDALLYLDDAHATGVLGAAGGGTCEHFERYSPNIMQMGSLGKALGAIGGFVAVDREVADVIRLTSSAFGFTSPPPPAQAAALLAALDLLQEEPQRRRRLWDNQRHFVGRMQALGYAFIGTDTPILSLPVGDAETCRRYALALRREGIHVDAIEFPAAPVGRARLRFMMNADHTTAQIDQLVGVMARLAT
jgi:glycine C-acetyltransferase